MHDASGNPPRVSLRFGALVATPKEHRHREGRIRALRQVRSFADELRKLAVLCDETEAAFNGDGNSEAADWARHMGDEIRDVVSFVLSFAPGAGAPAAPGHDSAERHAHQPTQETAVLGCPLGAEARPSGVSE